MSSLFDGGPEAYAITRNAERLKIEFGNIGAIVLSHGHWDHAGGLLEAVRKVCIRQRRQAGRAPMSTPASL